uniref:Uncharacterized protein n=1 Tax=Oryza meridionalis TaxID=40149 RepID=A0A0E0ERG0_9ORYZ
MENSPTSPKLPEPFLVCHIHIRPNPCAITILKTALHKAPSFLGWGCGDRGHRGFLLQLRPPASNVDPPLSGEMHLDSTQP